MLSTMAKKKPKPDSPEKKTKNVGIPISLWNQVKDIADRWDRSVNWTVKRLVELGITTLEQPESDNAS